jgi:alpha-L-rhamnosidase
LVAAVTSNSDFQVKHKIVRKLNSKFFLRFSFGLLSIIFSVLSSGQNPDINPSLLKGYWNAKWISCPGVPQRAYGIYHFRKTFLLDKIPDHFVIHVTADNRYHLFVNGNDVGRGPARGDLYNWNFETYDIVHYLRIGKNVLASEVWNMGVYAPVAQISNQTGFLVQGDDSMENIVNTNSTWKVMDDTAYVPVARNMSALLRTYMVVGPGDEVKGSTYPWGWQQNEFDDGDWKNAELINAAAVPFGYGSDNVWTLTPRTIPQMEEKLQRIASIRLSENISVADSFILADHPFTIPANTSVSILLDQGFETVAYPQLLVSKGKGSSIKLTYAEALVDSNDNKGNRNEVAGKTIRGLFDIFYPDGGNDRLFSPLWFRTYRYIRLDVSTGNEPLIIGDLYGIYTGYPFKHIATFASNDSSLAKIWTTGWRTARLCAGETYFDCPYYEELQYEADTRIQSLISLYNTGDDRLMRKAIHDFYDSRVPSGLTQGRYPSNRLQIIPTFSLFWISMLHDYWMLRDDARFIRQYLPAAGMILKWYEEHIDTTRDMLGPMNWWNFTDWNNAFPDGVPDGATDGNSSVITLQFVYTLNQAADLFEYFGNTENAQRYREIAKRLSVGTFGQCFDSAKMEMANTPDKNSFSQHASIWAILANALPKQDQKPVMKQILNDSTLSQATFYFRFYLTRALVKSGLGDLYYSQLTPWRNMLKIGLTTFAEKPEPTRSDCHGWSASPEYDFLATICGITPGKPGFKNVIITPHLGPLNHVKASMPCPSGIIEVDLRRKKDNGIYAAITLPGDLNGEFNWNGRTMALHPGTQVVNW